MTTTRINHTGHDHPSTTAARTACRNAMNATPVLVPACLVGKGDALHFAVLSDDGQLIGARCGAGLQRGRRAASTITRVKNVPASDIDCGRCMKH
jgi:hypothetical protein